MSTGGKVSRYLNLARVTRVVFIDRGWGQGIDKFKAWYEERKCALILATTE